MDTPTTQSTNASSIIDTTDAKKTERSLSKIGVIVICLAILSGATGIVYMIKFLAPEAKQKAPEVVPRVVEVMSAKRGDYEVKIPSQGLIEAKITGTLTAEVGGEVIWTDPRYQSGGEFSKGEMILQIESTNYNAALDAALSREASAELDVKLEESRAATALSDWKRIAKAGEEPSDLVLRTPYLKAARTALDAARADVAKARRDVLKTEILAPYDCQIVDKRIEKGSFAAPGSPLVDIESHRSLEVQLPISVDERSFLPTPSEDSPIAVDLLFSVGEKSYRWPATIRRESGRINRETRSTTLVAEVEMELNPELAMLSTEVTSAEEAGLPLADPQWLQPGLFVKVEIAGQKMKDVFQIPRRAFLAPKQLIVIDKESKIQFRDVEVAITDRLNAIVVGGLSEGDQVNLTLIDAPIAGMPVEIEKKNEPLAKQGEKKGPEVLPEAPGA